MRKGVLWGITALSLLLTSPLLHADSDKHHKGHGKGKHEQHRDDDGDHGHRDGGSYEAREVYYIEERYVSGGPPPWAPAHGYRRKHKEAQYSYDETYENRVYADNARITTQIGLDKGNCNHEKIATVIGGVAGGVIGNQAAKSEQDKALATVAGVFLGAVVGNTIGRSMDRNDILCTGQALERVADRQSVTWRHTDGRQYEVTPLRTFNRDGLFCREYQTRSGLSGGALDKSVQSACRAPDGSWSAMR